MSNAGDVVVVGGGAAGLMAALFAAREGARVTLLEGSQACGLKILVSGGGHCNVLPSEFDGSDFFTTGSRNVLNRLFRTWPLEDVRGFFEKTLEIPLVLEAESGKLFPESRSAKAVRDRLVAEVRRAGAEIRVNVRVTGIERVSGGLRVAAVEDDGEIAFETAGVVLATGGKSLPKTGSDGQGYAVATRLGHSLTALYPALVPLTSPDEALRTLAGISVPVKWEALRGKKCLESRERSFLFTHRGYSGPAILDASHWAAREGASVRIGWGALSPDEWTRRLRAHSRKRCDVLLSEVLPRRLSEALLERLQIQPKRHYETLNPKLQARLLDALCHFDLPVDGNAGYDKAEVTGGGIPLGEVNPSTLESRACPGLFVCGEIMDAIGRMGGYNFLWAWVTGRLAGESAARRMRCL